MESLIYCSLLFFSICGTLVRIYEIRILNQETKEDLLSADLQFDRIHQNLKVEDSMIT